jgi:hypothetical protein
MTFLGWVRGVAVSGSALIGTCYGDAWPVTFLNPCEEATNHLAECLSTSSSGECTGGCSPACDGQILCVSECIDSASCEALVDAFTGVEAAAAADFLACTTRCSAVSP